MQDTVTQVKSPTRDRLLDLAEEAVLQKGFGATSIEELVAGAGITKSGFFYHFKDKGDLAKALLVRHFERDTEILDGIFGRARELHEDPLHSFLIALKMFAEVLDRMQAMHPGCLVASICYQERLFNREVRELNAKGMLAWRVRFRAHLGDIAERYPPRATVDLDDLTDMLSTLVEGAIVMERALMESGILGRQIMLYRDFVRTTFSAN